MLANFFDNEILAYCAGLGLILIIIWAIMFFIFVLWAGIAELLGKPMPLDDNYWFGKINMWVWLVTGSLGGILFLL